MLAINGFMEVRYVPYARVRRRLKANEIVEQNN